MADMQYVHNTTAYSVCVSDDGRRVLGTTTQLIDISQPRAQKYLGRGTLILVYPNGQPENQPFQNPAPAQPPALDGQVSPDPETAPEPAKESDGEPAQPVERPRAAATKRKSSKTENGD